MESELSTRPRPVAESRLSEIAAAARSLIAERGFEGLRTRDIAERVGINVATLHYHVPTKERLIEIVAQSMRDEFIAQGKARPREGLSPLDEMKLELSESRAAMRDNPELYIVFTELVERARRDPRVDAAIRPMQQYWHQQLVNIFTRGRRDGSFRPDIDPRAAALVMMGGLMVSLRPLIQGVVQFDRLADELLRCFINPRR
jgi:AcrR family transcriptional regulator